MHVEKEKMMIQFGNNTLQWWRWASLVLQQVGVQTSEETHDIKYDDVEMHVWLRSGNNADVEHLGLGTGWSTDIRRDADSDPSRRRYLALHFKMVSRDENEHSGFSLSSQGSFCFSYIAWYRILSATMRQYLMTLLAYLCIFLCCNLSDMAQRAKIYI